MSRWRKWKTRPELRGDWEPRLNAWLERALATPHEFGEHDCMIAFAEAVEAQTGRDFAEGHRRKWRSRIGAARYLKALGFRSLEAMIDDLLDPVPPAFAQRGDVVLVSGEPGIVAGGEALIIHGDGHIWAPRSEWSKAWSVGARTAGAGK